MCPQNKQQQELHITYLDYHIKNKILDCLIKNLTHYC